MFQCLTDTAVEVCLEAAGAQRPKAQVRPDLQPQPVAGSGASLLQGRTVWDNDK